VEQCIFIPVEKNDLFGHAGGMVRFITSHLVVMNDYTEILSLLHQQLRRIFKRHRLDVEVLPYPPPRSFSFLGVPRKDIPILAAEGNYVNFLRVGDLILLPSYGIPEDELACRTLERLCPTVKIIPLPARELAEEGGVFHGISWTVQVGPS
jgi:agmatine deiminase